MRVVAGCDGGGTKCVVRLDVLDRNGSTVARGRGDAGPANIREDENASLQNIVSAVNDAIASADIPRDSRIDLLVAALAGAGKAELRVQWERRLCDALEVSRVHVVPDAVVLFADTDSEEPAVALVVGTGSIVWARNRTGEYHRSGGLGPTIGDEGSAYWIGLKATKHAVELARTGGPSTELTKAVQAHFRVSSLDDLDYIIRIPGSQRLRVAAMCTRVFELSSSDKTANALTKEAARHIADLLLAVTCQLRLTDDRPLTWICSGGVAVHQAEWLRLVRETCAGQGLFLQPPILVPEPVELAVKLAAADRDVSPSG